MSYSFTSKGNSPMTLLAEVEKKFDEICRAQPIHVKDRYPVVSCVSALTDVITLDAGNIISASVNGSVHYVEKPDEGLGAVKSVDVRIHVWQSADEPQAATPT